MYLVQPTATSSQASVPGSAGAGPQPHVPQFPSTKTHMLKPTSQRYLHGPGHGSAVVVLVVEVVVP